MPWSISSSQPRRFVGAGPPAGVSSPGFGFAGSRTNWLATGGASRPLVSPGCSLIFGRYTQAEMEKGSSPVRFRAFGDLSADLPSNSGAARPDHGEAPRVTPDA